MGNLYSNQIYSNDLYATDAAVFGVIAIFLLIYFLVLAVTVANYIMTSLGLYRIADRRNIANPWMAWLPYGSDWIIGSIVDDYDKRNGIKRKWRVVLLTLSLAAVVGVVVEYIVMFINIFALAFQSSYVEPAVSDVLGFLVILYVGIFILMFVSIALTICRTICIYKIFESTVPEKAVTYLMIYLFVPLGGGICLLKCKNKGYPYPEELAQTVIAKSEALQPEVVEVEPAKIESVQADVEKVLEEEKQE